MDNSAQTPKIGIRALEKRLMLDASLGALVPSFVLGEDASNAAEQIIDNDVTVSGTTTDFNGESLTITTTAGAEDQLSINNEGIGAGQIGVSGTDVTYEGTIIGTISSNGASGSPLQIDLNSNATQASIERLIENITYQNTSDTPAANRTISISLGILFSENVTISIAPDNDSPQAGINNGATLIEGATYTILNTDLRTDDPDNLAADVTYNITNAPIRGQLELTTNLGVAITSFTQENINNNEVVYVHDGNDSAFDYFEFTVTDGAIVLGEDRFDISIVQTEFPPIVLANNAIDVSLGFSTVIGGTADDFGTQVLNRGAGTSASFESIIDNQNSQMRITFTTPATLPDAVPGQVIFETGGSGNGTGLFLDDRNRLAFYSGSASTTPELLSAISLDTNTQYSVVIELDTSGNRIGMHYEQAANFDWFYEGRTPESERTGYTENDMAGSDGTGIGQLSGTAGGFNGTISGTTTFQGSIDSNLVITRTPGSSPTINTALVTFDNDTPPGQIVYTITNVVDYGTLRLDGVALGLNDIFTQADLNKGLITYDSVSSPPGPGFTDGFGFSVSDGNTTVNDSYVINVDTVNANPVIYDEVVILDEDFTGGTSGWNHNTTSTDTTLGEFWGRFNRNIDATNDQDLFQTFALSGTQEFVTIEFDFFEIDTWDNERFYFFVDDTRYELARIHHNTFNRPNDINNSNIESRVTELSNTNGYGDIGDSNDRDQFYHFNLKIPVTAGSVKIGFGTNLNSTNFSDESFGIDNLKISELRATGGGDTRSVSISETITNGDIVATIAASDDDVGQTLTYSITGGSGVGVFDIDANGRVSVTDDTQIDFDTMPTSYTLNIQVQDNGPGLLTDTQTLTINILDALENTRPNLTFTQFSIAEDTANGTSVGTLPFTDPEGDLIERWQIIDGNELGIFAIDQNTGEVTVADNASINFENDNRYDLRIRAWDDNFLGLFHDQTMRINITDVDDAPSLDREFVGENSGVPNVTYFAGTGNFYRFVDSNVNYATATANAAAMTLNGVAGRLLTVESAAEKAFVNSISDQHLWMAMEDTAVEGEWRYVAGPNAGLQFWQGAGSNNGGQSVNGFYTDWRGGNEPNGGTNENAVIFYRNDGRWVDVATNRSFRYMVEWDGTEVANNETYFINYDSPSDINNGDSVGSIEGLDPEGDTLTYSVQGGTGSALFNLDPVTGEITVANAGALDPNIDYTLTVRATEDNGANQFAETTITIVLNENLSIDANNGHTATEGGTTTINPTTELMVTDNDGVATDIIFDIDTFPMNGQLQLSTNPGVGIIEFTLDDLNNNRIQYIHDGGETTTDSFTFTVTDGGTTLPLETFNINITPVNDAPTLPTNTGTTVVEGANVTLTNAMLNAADVDNAAAGLTYTASNYVRGSIQVNGSTQNSFTQAQIDAGQVVFVHDGNEGGSASFDIALTDGVATPILDTFNLTVTPVNDAPLITTNTGFSVTEGTTVTITNAILETTDPDNSGTGLDYTINSITGGQIQLTTNLGTPILGFDQADIDAGRVVFVHDGSENDGNFNITVSDGALDDTVDVTATRIPVNDAPSITRNTGSSVNEGGITQLNLIVLDATDPDNSDTDLTYTVSGEVNGQLELLSNLGVQITSFTQLQLQAGDVVFRHDGSSTVVASFDMTVSDGTLSSPTDTFNFTVDNVNDPPVISVGAPATVNEGGEVAITTTELNSLDPDNLPITLTYSVTATSNGYVAFASDTSTPITSFSQVDLQNGIIRFVHDGTDTLTGSFDITLSDGSLTDTDTVNLNVTPVNDQTVLIVNDGSPNIINFNDYTILPYSAFQDGQGGDPTSFTVTPDGNELTLSGNAWKRIDIPYTLTANTVLSFDFKTDNVGEIYGIGFDTNDQTTDGMFGYQLNGTDVWSGANQSYNTYELGDGWVRFDIPIGNDYTGSIPQLVFFADKDAGPATAEGSWRNVNFYESDVVLTMAEGGSFNITDAHINHADPDDDGVELDYTATNIRNGHIEVDGNPQNTFTQQDIDDGDVVFVHDGTDTNNAGFDITLEDGLEDSTVTDTGSFNIIVTPVNDATSLITNNVLTLNEGARATITTTELDVADSDNTPSEVTINVTSGATNGYLALSSAPTTPITSFTLADLQNNRVEYVHNGGETISDSFSFTMSDGAITSSAQPFNITITPVNDDVALTTNTGTTINEGASFTITNTMLDITDPDNVDGDITYTVSGFTDGYIEVSGNPQNTFTQAQINAGNVVFFHDGSEVTSTSFDLSVKDPTGTATSSNFAITINPVNDAPVTSNGVLSVAEDNSQTIDLTHLITDAEGIDYTTDVIVSAPSNGTAILDTSTGIVTYTPNANYNGADSFTYTVDDGTGPQTRTINVTVTPVNDDVTLTTNTGATVTEGATVILNNTMLNITDPDNINSDITYTASGISNGHIEVGGNPQNTFSQAQIDAGQVVFVHDGSEAASSTFNLSVVDLTGTPDTANFTMTVLPVNDNPHALYLDNMIVSEDENPGFMIGNLSTDDVDLPGDSFTYSIMSDPDNVFAIIGNQLMLNSALNFQVAQTHDVTIRTDDGNGGTFDQLFTINVEEFIASDGVNRLPSDHRDYGLVTYRQLDEEYYNSSRNFQPLINNFIHGDQSDQMNAFYGQKSLGQIIRDYASFNVNDIVSHSDNVDISPSESEIEGVPNQNQQDRFTRMVDFLNSTQDHATNQLQDMVLFVEEDEETEGETGRILPNIQTSREYFDNTLNYHTERAENIRKALLS